MQQFAERSVASTSTDFLPLNGTDYVEFYVGNARQAAYYYRAAFGMSLVAYRGPETGTRDRVSYVVQQDKIRFVLTTPLSPDGAIADHINGGNYIRIHNRDGAVAVRGGAGRADGVDYARLVCFRDHRHQLPDDPPPPNEDSAFTTGAGVSDDSGPDQLTTEPSEYVCRTPNV